MVAECARLPGNHQVPRGGCRSESAGGCGQAVRAAGVGVAVVEGAAGREHAGGGCGRVEGAGAGDTGGASSGVRADRDGEGGVGAVPGPGGGVAALLADGRARDGAESRGTGGAGGACAVLPSTMVLVPVSVQTLSVEAGPVAVFTAWLYVTTMVSPVSSLPATPPLVMATPAATNPSWAAAVGLPLTEFHVL